MKYVTCFFLLLFIGFSLSCSFLKDGKGSCKQENPVVKISFDIYLGKTKMLGDRNEELYALIKETNLCDTLLDYFYFPLQWGLKSRHNNHVEVFDLDGAEVDAERDVDYQIVLDSDYELVLKKGESRESEIDLFSFVKFKKPGIYKLRFVSVEYGNTIYSNWDTLIVKSSSY